MRTLVVEISFKNKRHFEHFVGMNDALDLGFGQVTVLYKFYKKIRSSLPTEDVFDYASDLAFSISEYHEVVVS